MYSDLARNNQMPLVREQILRVYILNGAGVSSFAHEDVSIIKNTNSRLRLGVQLVVEAVYAVK